MSNQVHRFHNTVAAYIGTGPTCYMTPGQARAFGQALIAAADDIDETPFVKSDFETFHGRTLEDNT